MLDTWSRCQIQWQRRYGARFGLWHTEEIVPPGVAAAVGTAVHEAIAHALREKISGVITPTDEVMEIARDQCVSMWQAGLLLTTTEESDIDRAMGRSIDDSVSMASFYHTTRLPEINPAGVESKFNITLPYYDFNLGGVIDIIDDNTDIIDIKTGKRNFSSAITLQMAIYSILVKATTKKFPRLAIIDKLGKNKIESLSSTPNDSWIRPAMMRIQVFAEWIQNVKAGKAPVLPAAPDSWVCTSAYCGYSRNCRYWTGREK